MAGMVKQNLAKPIQLADQASKGADNVSNFKAECVELKAKTEKLVTLLWQATHAGSDLYEQPLRRIIDVMEQALDKALTLVVKCRTNSIMKQVFTIIPVVAFKKVTAQLGNSIREQWKVAATETMWGVRKSAIKAAKEQLSRAAEEATATDGRARRQ